MKAVRVFLIGSVISYRALFNWISPVMYTTTMLGAPLFQILFFAYLGRFSGLRDDTFFVLGNAIQDIAAPFKMLSPQVSICAVKPSLVMFVAYARMR